MPNEKACERSRNNLLNCLLQSECYKIENKTPRECMQQKENMPEECKEFVTELSNCKRSQVNMRMRFRGKRDDGVAA